MNKSLLTFAAAAVLVAGAVGRARGGDSPYSLLNPAPQDKLRGLQTDRPDKTNTPVTADPGHVIIETGVFDDDYNQDHYQGGNARTNDLSVGQVNFRVGILDNLELNVVVNSWDFFSGKDYTSGESERQNSVGDTVVGGKFNFWGNDIGDKAWDSAFGIQSLLKIPTARAPFTGNGHAELDIGLPFLMNLPDGFHAALETTAGWDRNSTGDADVTGWQNSISVDRVLSEKYPFDVYVEYWNFVTTERHQEAQQTLDVGFTYPVNDNLQLDTGVNFGLNRASDSIEVTAGISVRI